MIWKRSSNTRNTIEILATIDGNIPMQNIMGIVRGSTVISRNIGKDMIANIKSLIGGEVKTYTTMLDEARDVAIERMSDKALSLSADSVVGVQFSTCFIAEGVTEIMVYGTAIKGNVK